MIAPIGRASAVFVGREPELAALTAKIEASSAGRGGMALIAGEPGIGKTRLAEELAAIAHERGARVLWGRCYEGDGAPAFWPWVEILRGYLQRYDATTVRDDLASATSSHSRSMAAGRA